MGENKRYFLVSYFAQDKNTLKTANGCLTFITYNGEFVSYNEVKDSIEFEVENLVVQNIFEFKSGQDFEQFGFKNSKKTFIDYDEFVKQIQLLLQHKFAFEEQQFQKLISDSTIESILQTEYEEGNRDFNSIVKKIFNI